MVVHLISSNKSSTEWKTIAARIKWNCARISEILKEMSEEEEHPDPEIAKADAEIQIQETESTATKTQKADTISNIQPTLNPDLQISVSENQNSESNSLYLPSEPVTTIRKTPDSTSNHNEDGGSDVSSGAEEDDRQKAIGSRSNSMGTTPPSIRQEDNCTSDGEHVRKEAISVLVSLISSSFNAKFAEREHGPQLFRDFFGGDQNMIRSGAEVGASIKGKGKGKTVVMAEMTNDTPETEMSNRRLHHRGVEANRSIWHASPIATKPPALVAAAFPWDREWGTRIVKKRDEVTEADADRGGGGAIDGGTRGGWNRESEIWNRKSQDQAAATGSLTMVEIVTVVMKLLVEKEVVTRARVVVASSTALVAITGKIATTVGWLMKTMGLVPDEEDDAEESSNLLTRGIE